jgi:hypothetical protein
MGIFAVAKKIHDCVEEGGTRKQRHSGPIVEGTRRTRQSVPIDQAQNHQPAPQPEVMAKGIGHLPPVLPVHFIEYAVRGHAAERQNKYDQDHRHIRDQTAQCSRPSLGGYAASKNDCTHDDMRLCVHGRQIAMARRAMQRVIGGLTCFQTALNSATEIGK